MGSSSLSFSNYTHCRSHSVFLSFRGEDTRKTFVCHLYNALIENGIETFKDDEELEIGSSISPELLKAIEQSELSIVILSENYALSKWCLDELVKILECRKTLRQMVIPIFYNVNPSDVRKQAGSFGNALSRHETTSTEKVQKWREALTEVGNIAGLNSGEYWNDSNLINEIVGNLSSMVSKSSNSNNGILCHCGERAQLKTSRTNLNPERRFLGCPNYGTTEACQFFSWFDPPTCARGSESEEATDDDESYEDGEHDDATQESDAYSKDDLEKWIKWNMQ